MRKQGPGTREQGTGTAETKLRVPPVRGPRGQVFVRGVEIPRIWGPGNLLGPAVILLAATVVMVPQFIRGSSCGHDFNVHLVSWIDCLNAWRHGILYPHWTPSANYGAGEPRFVFYPPLTWMLGATLGTILPWNFAPIALTFIIFAATGLATRALALEALEDAPATLAGCVSIFSGFTLFTGYERCAFPEFAGGFWLPLIILFALRDRSSSASLVRHAPLAKRIFNGSTVPLAIALAGAWLSNLPLGVMAGYLLVGVALLWAIVNKSWAPLFRAAIATILGLGLAAIYWVPATLQRHWVDISQATDDPGFNFENNWLFSRHANPILALHDVILRQVSWIAVSMIAVALAAVLICWRRGTLPVPKASSSREWWIPLAAIPIVVLFLLFPISRPLWHTLPQMPFLQYPWRWLEAVEAPMSIFVVAAVWPNSHNARMARGAILAACAAFFVAATIYAGTRFFQVCYPEDTVASMLIDYRSGADFEGMYEYEPPNTDISTVPTGMPDACLVTDPNIVLGKPDPDDSDANPVWTPYQGTCLANFTWAAGPRSSPEGTHTSAGGAQLNPEHRALLATIPRSGYLVLHLLRYPAWSIGLNGQRITNLPSRNDGLMVVPVPQGSIDLTVDWTTSPGDVAGRWLAIMSALMLIALSLCELRLGRSRLT